MAKWKYECDIKKYIFDKTMNIHEKVEKIADEISKCKAFDDTLFAEYLTEMLDLEDDELEAESNSILNDIYNFADRRNVWMGVSWVP